jgi:hypothetical protein
MYVHIRAAYFHETCTRTHTHPEMLRMSGAVPLLTHMDRDSYFLYTSLFPCIYVITLNMLVGRCHCHLLLPSSGPLSNNYK